MNVVGDEDEQNLARNWHQNQNTSGFRVRRAMEKRLPRHFEDFSVWRNDAGQRALMEHRWDFAGLYWYKIAANAVDDRLENDEAGEFADRSFQHQTSHAEGKGKSKKMLNHESNNETYPLMNKADSTGIHPLFNTGRVYRLRNTSKTQNGNRKQ